MNVPRWLAWVSATAWAVLALVYAVGTIQAAAAGALSPVGVLIFSGLIVACGACAHHLYIIARSHDKEKETAT